MKSLYSAYQAYGCRAIRGEMDGTAGKVTIRSNPREPLLTQLSDLLIQTGLKHKHCQVAGKSMTWSPLFGSKP